VEQLAEELVVYDLDTDQAHLLNRMSSAVWRRCDGSTDIDALASDLSAEFGMPVDPVLVWAAVAELDRAGLLEPNANVPAEEGGLSRRQLLKRFGIAAVALPTITSILAPTAAAAASVGTGIGGTCASNGACASGNCVPHGPGHSDDRCDPCTSATCAALSPMKVCNATTGNCN
jgi:hypothetical protein